MPNKKDPTPDSKRLKNAVEEYSDKKMDSAGASKLVEHAERELRLAGVFDQDADYEGMLGHAVMELIRVFASQHHSGASGSITLALFETVAKWELLSEPTDDPAEWEDQSLASGSPLWQNKRGPAYFSKDGGKHWKHVGTDREGTSKPANLSTYSEGSLELDVIAKKEDFDGRKNKSQPPRDEKNRT